MLAIINVNGKMILLGLTPETRAGTIEAACLLAEEYALLREKGRGSLDLYWRVGRKFGERRWAGTA